MKLQHRTASIFASITISLVLVVSLLEYYFANQNTHEDFYKRLEIRAITAAKARFAEAQMGKSAYEEIRKQHLETLPDEQEFILPADSPAALGTANIDVPGYFFQQALAKGKARYRNHNKFYLAYLYNDKSGRYIVVLSAKNEFIESYLNNLKWNIVLSVLVTAGISVLIGLWFSNLVLRPIRIITRKMQDINASQLHLRLSVSPGNDEITGLSQTFNNMLDRLETSFETQKNFISNASHELNTPLTAIIGESELALAKERESKDYVRSLSVILTEAERLRKITSSLLQLAQTGYTDKVQRFSQLRVDEIVYTVKETVDNIIPDNRVFINASLLPEDGSKLLIAGNQQLLELALTNIVINGCKYSRNQPVQITIASTRQHVIVFVEDRGIGIPQNEIAYIYEPFFRASNTGRFAGYGIGLPLARNIIRMHRGELDVTSEEGAGTKIRITLPLYDL